MYLRGSKWSMQRRKRRSSPWRVFFLAAAVAGMLYINQVVVPATPPLFVPTPTPTRSPDTFLQEAQQMIGEGKINQAIETYKEAVKADPRNPSIYVTLARLEVLYGQYDDAMANIENALLLSSNHALARAVRGWILGKQGEFLAGEGELNNALKLDPNSALAYAYLTELYTDMLATSMADLNTQQKAIDASKRAMDLDPSLLEVRRARGLILQNTNNHEEAIVEFEAAIAMNENLAELYIALGRSYRFTEQTDRAVDAFLRGIALRPDDSEPYAELAATYQKAGEYSKGQQYAEEAIKRDPTDAFLYGLLGTMYFRTEQYQQAVYPLKMAVRGGLTPDGVQVEPLALDASDAASVAYFSRYGIALAEMGQCGEALQAAQELTQKAPMDENAAYNAQVMIDTCREQVDAPQPTSSETPAPTATP